MILRLFLAVLLAPLGAGRAMADAAAAPQEAGPVAGEGTLFVQSPIVTPSALRKAQRLAGHDEFAQQFTIEQVMQAAINGLPESLLVIVRTNQVKLLDSAWWFDPICFFRPRYDWYDFIDLFHHVDGLLTRHAWLAEWKSAGRGRVVELHAFGRGPASADLGGEVLPIWHEAGFRGRPRYEVLARRGNQSWVRMYFNDDDPKLLISYSMDRPANPVHWLDALDVAFHPRCRTDEPSARYAVIEPDGTWQIREFAGCELPLRDARTPAREEKIPAGERRLEEQ